MSIAPSSFWSLFYLFVLCLYIFNLTKYLTLLAGVIIKTNCMEWLLVRNFALYYFLNALIGNETAPKVQYIIATDARTHRNLGASTENEKKNRKKNIHKKQQEKQKQRAREQVNIKQCFISVLFLNVSLYLHATNGFRIQRNKNHTNRVHSVCFSFSLSRFLLEKKTPTIFWFALYIIIPICGVSVFNIRSPVNIPQMHRFCYVCLLFIFLLQYFTQKPMHSFTLISVCTRHFWHILVFNFPYPIIIHLKFIDLELCWMRPHFTNAPERYCLAEPRIFGVNCLRQKCRLLLVSLTEVVKCYYYVVLTVMHSIVSTVQSNALLSADLTVGY